MKPPKLSTAAIMLHIAGNPPARNYALAICQDTRYPSGTVVPALRRLSERDGLLERTEEPTTTGRPRFVYALTADGQEYVDGVIELLAPVVSLLHQSDTAKGTLSEKVNLSTLILLASALRNGGATYGYSDEMRPLTHQAAYTEIARMSELGWMSPDGHLTPEGRNAAAMLGAYWDAVVSRARR